MLIQIRNIAVFTITVAFASLLILVFLIFSTYPTVSEPKQLEHTDISNIKKQFSESNPFKRKRYGLKHVSFDEKTLNQAVHLASNKILKIPFRIKLETDAAKIQTSSKITIFPFNLYLNTTFDVVPSENFFELENLGVGGVPIPNWLISLFTPYIMQAISDRYPSYIELVSAIRKIEIKPQRVSVSYRWNNIVANHAQSITRDVLLTAREQQLVSVYYTKLSEISRLTFWRRSSLDTVIKPMFKLAQERTFAGGDPIEENRAVILTLGLAATAVPIRHLIKFDKSKRVRNVRFYNLTLRNRRDLMQHFLISAALTVSTNKGLTDAIGLSKEMEDSQGGSGFSFADLLADRVGVNFAESAIKNRESAVALQKFMAKEDLKEPDYMPNHKNLPEAITSLEFKKRFIDVKHEQYLFVENELTQRIRATPLYKH